MKDTPRTKKVWITVASTLVLGITLGVLGLLEAKQHKNTALAAGKQLATLRVGVREPFMWNGVADQEEHSWADAAMWMMAGGFGFGLVLASLIFGRVSWDVNADRYPANAAGSSASASRANVSE